MTFAREGARAANISCKNCTRNAHARTHDLCLRLFRSAEYRSTAAPWDLPRTRARRNPQNLFFLNFYYFSNGPKTQVPIPAWLPRVARELRENRSFSGCVIGKYVSADRSCPCIRICMCIWCWGDLARLSSTKYMHGYTAVSTLN